MDILSPVIYQLGLGGIGGFVIGFTVKKISKLIIFLLGVLLIFLLYLGTSGIISINFEELWRLLEELVNWGDKTFLPWITGLISVLPFMSSFVVGFAFGLKFG